MTGRRKAGLLEKRKPHKAPEGGVGEPKLRKNTLGSIVYPNKSVDSLNGSTWVANQAGERDNPSSCDDSREASSCDPSYKTSNESDNHVAARPVAAHRTARHGRGPWQAHREYVLDEVQP